MQYPYQDAALTIRERVTDLLSRMSTQEKIGQVNQHLYGWETFEDSQSLTFTEKFKAHVEWGGGVGALYGLFRADPWSKVNFENGVRAQDSWRVANKVQEYVMAHSRWGIPALIVEECPHGHQGLEGISYPTNIGRGNMFNTRLMQQSSHLMAQELALKGVNLALVSTLDLVKDPRWGRSEECFGEDPILAARMSEAVVAGFQGDLIQSDVAFLEQPAKPRTTDAIGVVLKHCIAQGEALGGHNSGTVTIGQREFSDVYEPLLSSVKNAAGVMAAYNDVDGVPCHINQPLLTQDLRDVNGFQGIVMADGVALDRLSGIFETQPEAAAAALNAGVDLSLWDQTFLTLDQAIENGLVDEAALDNAAGRVLALKFLLGLFEQPYVQAPNAQLTALLEKADALNLQVARESMTLVKNNGLLPIRNQPQKIAVIGPNADELYNLLGDYTAAQSSARQAQTIYQAIQEMFPESEVVYALGCEVRNSIHQEEAIAKVVELARDADLIIPVLGGSSARNFDMAFLSNGAVSSKGINMDSGENVDVASLSLGGQQEVLLKQLKALGKPIACVMVQGRPYDLTLVNELADAVLIAWFPGQQGGRAIAETLVGLNNPSGKLSVSYPRNTQQLPVYYYQRDAAKQDDYYDEVGQPLYPFGYGLSYDQFDYRQLAVKQMVDKLVVTVKVKNNGQFVGQESSLLFVKLTGGAVIQRTKLLKAFQKNAFQPGEEKSITFELPAADFNYMDIDNQVKRAQAATIMVADLAEKITLSI